MQAAVPTWLQRAKPLLGTLVLIRVQAEPGNADLGSKDIHALMQRSFDAVETIANAMSAHHADSDLARLARAVPGEVLTLSPHTVAVLRLAKYWHQVSLGAFDPVKAADHLAARGMRPAFGGVALAARATLRDLQVLSDDQIRLVRPVRLDLGGIAKGYAVDQAIAVLQSHGVRTALVNAGGDLRGVGDWTWPVAVRRAAQPTRTQRIKGLKSVRNAALATSTAAPLNDEFVATRRCTSSMPAAQSGWGWQSCTVRAPDCVTADALTKWGLQSPAHAPRLQRILRLHKATLWRS